ncbi:unnamed protein product [Auanema sp. JU1783]|nr:unnamed protein product [Auanema sp. JU1783]
MVALTSAHVLGRQQFQKNEFNTDEVIAKAFEAYMPDFLSSVSASSRSEFIKIYSNSTIPRSQIETQLNQWAVQNGVQVLILFVMK